ncbi:fluoride efflux transporter CrcB [Numidum massiliense]|uniref:fluoride efflux transporter CrcB n=1 Tax=Numidum massiliense TaxID=1522315 RepID=UPI0006D5A34A|nr:fluoride efflux transporter CrcB [Numidum massiliense]
MALLYVALGGGLGALFRYEIGRLVAKKWTRFFPLATAFVNVSGSFALGVLTPLAAQLGEAWMLLLATGGLGAYTTFSTFSVETVTLWQRGQRRIACVYVAASMLLGFAAAGVGFWLGTRMASGG